MAIQKFKDISSRKFSSNLDSQNFLPALSRFTRLEKLVLPPAEGLKLGLDRSNYRDVSCSGDTKLLSRIIHEGSMVSVVAVNMIVPYCPKLKILWIGDREKAEVVRGENGEMKDLEWVSERRDLVVSFPEP